MKLRFIIVPHIKIIILHRVTSKQHQDTKTYTTKIQDSPPTLLFHLKIWFYLKRHPHTKEHSSTINTTMRLSSWIKLLDSLPHVLSSTFHSMENIYVVYKSLNPLIYWTELQLKLILRRSLRNGFNNLILDPLHTFFLKFNSIIID